MRLLFRFLSLLALVVAVIAGAIDAIQSVAAEAVVLTPLGAAWTDASPATLETVRGLVAPGTAGVLAAPLLAGILAQPAFAVFLALSLLLYVIGYRRKRLGERFFQR